MDLRAPAGAGAEPRMGELSTAVFVTAVDSIIVIDGDGLIRELNPAAVRNFGYSREELLGRNIGMLMPDADRRRHDEHLAAHQVSGLASSIGEVREVQGRRKDGSSFPCT